MRKEQGSHETIRIIDKQSKLCQNHLVPPVGSPTKKGRPCVSNEISGLAVREISVPVASNKLIPVHAMKEHVGGGEQRYSSSYSEPRH
jgi:hypothetical protein